jgi:YfiH family protein
VSLWFEPEWPLPKGVRALSSLRGDLHGGGHSQGPYARFNLGTHVGDEPAAVAENRRFLMSRAGLPAEPCWLAQVHGVAVADLDATDPDAAGVGAGPVVTADAAVTRRLGKVCAILTADCLPILFATDRGDVVAAAHAGWRGLAAGVIGATVRALAVPPDCLMAWLGPAISRSHFEVGAEVREAFLRTDAGAGDAFEAKAAGKFMADLGMLARRQLEHLGVRRIYGGGECTYARADRYFSHRRDGVTGRQATLIWREAGENG